MTSPSFDSLSFITKFDRFRERKKLFREPRKGNNCSENPERARFVQGPNKGKGPRKPRFGFGFK